MRTRTREELALIFILGGVAMIMAEISNLSLENPEAIIINIVGIVLIVVALYLLRSVKKLQRWIN